MIAGGEGRASGDQARAVTAAFTSLFAIVGFALYGLPFFYDFFVRDLGAPFGGNGQSGIGREGGIWSFDFYSDIKNTVFAPRGWTVRTPAQ